MVDEEKSKGTRAEAASTLRDSVKPVPYFKIFSFCTPLEWVMLLVSAAGSAASGLTIIAFAILMGRLLDQLGPGTSNEQLASKVLILVYAFLIVAGVALVACYLGVGGFMTHAVRIANCMRTAYLKAILRQDAEFFDLEGSSGGLLSSLNQDTAMIQDGLGEKASAFIQNGATFVGGIVVAFITSWDTALVAVACYPLLGTMGALISTLVSSSQTRGSAAHRSAAALSQEAFGNIKSVAAFNAQASLSAKYSSKLAEPRSFERKQAWAQGTVMGLGNAAFFFLFSVVLWYGARKVAHGTMTGGQVLTTLFSAAMAAFSLGMALPSLQYFQKASAAGGVLFHVLDMKPKIDNLDPSGVIPDSCAGAIRLRNVTFAYPSRRDVDVFRSLTLDIPAGHSVALVGESGSGKSTTIALLLRFYDPQGGSITMDGVDLKDLNVKWLRSRMGLVSQEPTLFATSILENVRYGKPGATDEEVIAALKSANAWKFIKLLPEGVNTNVGEKGLQMSGGQKQRIAIARAIIKAPTVLLLDEATSALDAQSERVVQVALDSVMKGRTTVIVAHRLSTIRGADKIAVMRKGEVIEEGTHTMLSLRGGAYASLIRAQHGSVIGSVLGSVMSGSSAAADVKALAWAEEQEELAAKEEAAKAALAASESEVVADGGSAEAEAAGKGGPKAKKPKGPKDKVPFGRIWALTRREWPLLVVAVVCSTAVGCVMPVFGLLFALILSALYKPRDQVQSAVQILVDLFVAGGFVSLIVTTLQGGSLGIIAANLAMRLRSLLFRAFLRQDQAFFDVPEHSTGNLSTALTKDAFYVKGVIADSAAVIIQNISTLALAYTLSLYYSWRVALVITAALPGLVLTGVFQAKFAMGFDQEASLRFGAANSTASDAMANVKVIQAFSLVEDVSGLYRKQLERPTRDSIRAAQISGFGFGVSTAYLFCLWGLGFWFGSTQIRSAGLSFKDFINSLMVLIMAGQGFQQAQMTFPDLSKGASAAIKIFKAIDRVPPIDPESESGDKPASVAGLIEFTDVHFRYPARPTVEVFQGLTLTIPAGRTVALCGESGSGKSTAVALIQRWYDPESGSVRLDGRDLRDLCVRWLRSHMALVQQEPVLFAGTVADNITFGDETLTREQVEKAAALANASKFIEALPEGYDTLIGEGGGVQLSGGQKQRVAIARAVIRDPRVLLLDEATSALDAESERAVQVALDSVMKGRTTVIVAHRLSTIRGADKIAVMQQGRVVEEGGHTMLSLRGGAYANLIRLQNKA